MPRLLAITGGVGGAKLAVGLSKLLAPEDLLFAVNTGDDFTHFGLHIAPDLDSLTYALCEQNNTELGWGRADESWHFIDAMEQLGGDTWFRLGDKDLALHLHRTELLRSGLSLTTTTARITAALGIRHGVVPMSDDAVRTHVHTELGTLAFQHYFVRERCEPPVSGFTFEGVEKAQLNPAIAAFLGTCDGVIICPSNPYVSVDPLLQLAGMREALLELPVIAVSPIVGGMAIKGPAAKMMKELRIPATAAAVAAHYADLIDGFVLDTTDAAQAEQIALPTLVTQTIMRPTQDKVALAEACLGFLQHCS